MCNIKKEKKTHRANVQGLNDRSFPLPPCRSHRFIEPFSKLTEGFLKRRDSNWLPNAAVVHHMERIFHDNIDVREMHVRQKAIAVGSVGVSNCNKLHQCRRLEDVDVVLSRFNESHARTLHRIVVWGDLLTDAVHAKYDARNVDVEIWFDAKLTQVLIGGKYLPVDKLT